MRTSGPSVLPRIPLVDLRAQYDAIKEEVDRAIVGVLADCDFILGRAVERFEEEFADYVGTTSAVGVGSGLDALRLTLTALGIGPGDEVIVPANTFVASVFAIMAAGARPMLVDCDPDTYGIDVHAVDEAVGPRTRAIMPVHLTGQAADMGPLLKIAADHGLAVVEDAAQAHGATYRGRRCGSLGTAGCFSFYPAKNLGAYGDGGMITTSDPGVAERLRALRNCGQRSKNEHVEFGWNSRLDTLQAAVLRVKLRHLDEWNAARRRNAERYRDALAQACDLRFQSVTEESGHVYHLFVVETRARDALRRHLAAGGIDTGIHYPTPVHLQPACARLGYAGGEFPNAEALADRVLSLPMYAELSEAAIARVCEQIAAFFGPGGAGA